MLIRFGVIYLALVATASALLGLLVGGAAWTPFVATMCLSVLAACGWAASVLARRTPE